MNTIELDNLTLYRQDIMKSITINDLDVLCDRVYRQNDKEAIEELFNANLYLVVKLARTYMRDNKFDLLDLIQEGNIGLMRAIELFDYSKGYRFQTYAKWHILKGIRKYVRANNTLIKIPDYQVSNIYSIKKEYGILESTTEGEVTHEMVAKNLGMRVGDVKYLFMISQDTDSINKVIPNESEGSTDEVGDLLEDSAINIELDAIEKYKKDELDRILKSVLNEREMFVIKSRFGFITGNVITYDRLGVQLGITKQRVFQIEKAALKKLRNKKSNKIYDLFYK